MKQLCRLQRKVRRSVDEGAGAGAATMVARVAIERTRRGQPSPCATLTALHRPALPMN